MSQDHFKAEVRQPCESAIAKGLAPPSKLSVRFIERAMSAAWIAENGDAQRPSFTSDIISRGLHVQLLAPTNLAVKSHTQVSLTSYLDLITAIVFANVWFDFAIEQERKALGRISPLRGLLLCFGSAMAIVCDSKHLLWSYDKAIPAPISTFKNYLAHCEGLNVSHVP